MWRFGLDSKAVDFAAVLKSLLILIWRFPGAGRIKKQKKGVEGLGTGALE